MESIAVVPSDKPVKVKKPRSAAQIEAFKKGIAKLELMRAARKVEKEKKIKEKTVTIDVATDPVAPVAPQTKKDPIDRIDPIAKIDPLPAPAATLATPAPKRKYEKKPKDSITKSEFDNFKNELMGFVRQPLPSIAPIAPPTAPEPIIREVIKERIISGSELLNRIFFR